MKDIYYKLPNFYKALKRNNVNYVYYDDCGNSFWFFTRKAIINCNDLSDKEVEVIKTWFVTHGIEVKYAF